MATALKLRRGTTAQHASFTGALGEITVDTDKDTVVVHDGSTAGGFPLAKEGSTTAFAAGTASLPSITFTGDTNTGIFSPAADTIAFTEGGAEAMRIDSNGNVGIGTTSPSGAFNISRDIETQIFLNRATTTTGAVFLRFTNGGGNYYVGPDSSTGNRGFGTGGAAYGLVINVESAYPICFGTNNTERMRIDSSGNVGIGTTSPSYRLDVSGFDATARINSSVAGGNSALRFLSGTGNNAAILFGDTDAADVGFIQYVHSDNSLRVNVNSAERARITSDGNLFINTTNALVAGRKLQVVKDGGGPVIFKVENGVGNEVLLIWNNATSGNNLFQEFATEGAITIRGSIDYNRAGGAVRYNTTSDATLKNIIGDADGQKSLEILNSTRIREYAWKDDPTQKPQIGVIAQELYETFKGAVSVGGEVEETDDDGNLITKHRHWAVDKTAFTFHLVAGWQAHEKKIAEQQAKIDALETRLAALEAK